MGLARGRGRGKLGLPKGKGRGIAMKPPPLMGRLAPPPPDMLRPPRGMPVPHPGLLPRMRPPPPGMRSPRLLLPPPGPRRPPLPLFMPPPPSGPRSFPPAMPRPPMSSRPPMPLLRPRPRPGQRPPPPGLRPIPPLGVGPPMVGMGAMGRLGRGGKRIGAINKGKAKGKKTNTGELQENELNKPWVTEAMKNEIMKKHKLYQKAKKSNEENDWKEFKDQKTRVTTMIREAKLEYIGNHPEEGKEHYCETCDREFKNESKLVEHIQEHRTCGLDGCQFMAHPKVISKHVQMQHETGFYKKIGNLYSPDDIAKWIGDRKRLYPSKENIVKRQAEQEEKLKRGERLAVHKNNFNRNSVSFTSRGRQCIDSQGRNKKFGRQWNRGRGRGRSNSGASAGIRKRPWLEISQEDDEILVRTLPPFPGTAAFFSGSPSLDEDKKEENQEKFSDSEWETSSNVVEEGAGNSNVNIPVVSKALSSLMGLYASDVSESEDESKVQELISCEDVKVQVDTAVNKANESFLADSCATGETVKSIKQTVKTSSEFNNSDSGPDEAPILRTVTGIQNDDSVCTIEDSNGHKNSGENFRKRVRRCRSNFSKKSVAGDKIQETVEERQNSVHKSPYIKRRKLTLLEKLLSREICLERNVMLQCVRYAVQNNFFNNDSKNVTRKCMPNSNVILECIHYVVGTKFNLSCTQY